MEFALDNVQKLKLRNAKLQAQQQESHDDLKDVQEDDVSHELYDIPRRKENSRKRKSQVENIEANDSELDKNEEENMVSEEASPKNQRNDKKRKSNGGSRKKGTPAQGEFNSTKQKVKGSVQEQTDHRVRKPDNRSAVKGEMAARNTDESKPSKEADLKLKKRKLSSKAALEDGEKGSKKRSKKNKDPLGRDIVDKLDMLIEEYKSKFSKQSSQKPGGEKQANKPLKRWFQS